MNPRSDGALVQGACLGKAPALHHSNEPPLALVSIGDQIRPGHYRLHSRFHRVANFIHGSDMVFLADESLGGGPVTVLVRGRDIGTIDQLDIRSDRISIPNRTLPLDGVARYVSRPDWDPALLSLSMTRLEAIKRVLREEAHPDSLVYLLKNEMSDGQGRRGQRPRLQQEPSYLAVAAGADRGSPAASSSAYTRFDQSLKIRLADGARLLQNALMYNHPTCLARAVLTLKGCGRGLTPSGDDYLAGCLTALHWAVPRKPARVIRRVMRLARGDNPLVNTFLRMAGHGRLIEPMKVFVESLFFGTARDLSTGVSRLLEHGETSGADWATGFIMTLEGRN